MTGRNEGENAGWSDAAGLVRLFAFCALLGASTTTVKALTLGVIASFSLMATVALQRLARRLVAPVLHAPTAVLILVGVISAVETAMHAAWPELHRQLGVFLPVLAGSAALLATAGFLTDGRSAVATLRETAGASARFLLLAVLLGAAREIVGHGSVLRDAPLLLEPFIATAALTGGLALFAQEHGFLLALLPPGAFIALGLLLALRKRFAFLP